MYEHIYVLTLGPSRRRQISRISTNEPDPEVYRQYTEARLLRQFDERCEHVATGSFADGLTGAFDAVEAAALAATTPVDWYVIRESATGRPLGRYDVGRPLTVVNEPFRYQFPPSEFGKAQTIATNHDERCIIVAEYATKPTTATMKGRIN